MGSVRQVEVSPDSLLARYGSAQDYRDCFAREVAGHVTLEQFIERFYCSAAFRPERIVLGLIGRGASNADARALARGETDRFAVWEVVERSDLPSGSKAVGHERHEILLHSKDTGTASWLAVSSGSAAIGQTGTSLSSGAVGQTGTSSSSAAVGQSRNPGTTTLYFGSWVGNLGQSGWRFMQQAHVLYSRVLLESAADTFL
ncbi:hypothetical protein AMC99_02281 [Altererythrobacter epoxidivorans]|uniref:Uncharacterized protein n=1 Tax=Altererythrobacter epoxidivorans TaxID=361183 RepID=A0A0M3TAY7_9SPHN|nr:hypothetical protein [Altererythrobacter epoxidivorans]ALE17556.1 hypothetical protein AMC99_02281 [Altererythrobacter epoxidivorans]